MAIEIINVSTKGQIVLPSKMREKLGIKEGDRLFAYLGEDSILIKKMKLPSKEEFEESIKRNMEIAKETGLTEEDIKAAVKEYRAERKKL